MIDLVNRRIKVDEIIFLSFKEFFRNIKDIFLITLVFGIPTAIANFMEEKDVIHDSIFKSYNGGFVSFLTMLFVSIGSMAIIKLVSESIKGNKIGWEKAIRDTLPKSVSTIIASILGIIIIAVFTFLLIIPGIIACIALSLSLQFIVLENSEALKSLQKSKNLLDGEKWDVFVKLFLLGIIICLIEILITMGMNVLVVSFSPIIIIGSLISSLLGQVIVIATTIIYINLKNLKETYDFIA
ncbi:hypothetical protein SAMN02745163_00458 [Clostridium cavendishii DSM 21758]|uniref:Membrane domain of glycerophosphoryl diester phosphodiesterase n=1 Tax=Clostridium cavendishii DSM 21758 TaxID=1121302 RepID=A0A1M6CGV4_9CLOT|nr:hypothetical protein [Clostridium cavendishii]SHI59984.1 hypothetical protein SAMN02745163_00458 [Clostridium cavendishii DSM 21758]